MVFFLTLAAVFELQKQRLLPTDLLFNLTKVVILPKSLFYRCWPVFRENSWRETDSLQTKTAIGFRASRKLLLKIFVLLLLRFCDTGTTHPFDVGL